MSEPREKNNKKKAASEYSSAECINIVTATVTVSGVCVCVRVGVFLSALMDCGLSI